VSQIPARYQMYFKRLHLPYGPAIPRRTWAVHAERSLPPFTRGRSTTCRLAGDRREEQLLRGLDSQQPNGLCFSARREAALRQDTVRMHIRVFDVTRTARLRADAARRWDR